MQDLKDTTQDVHYENFRAQCISQISHQALRGKKRESISSNDTVSETDRLLLQKDEEVCVCLFFSIFSSISDVSDSITQQYSDFLLQCTKASTNVSKTNDKEKTWFYLQIRRMQDRLVQMQEKLKTNTILEMNKKNDSVIDV